MKLAARGRLSPNSFPSILRHVLHLDNGHATRAAGESGTSLLTKFLPLGDGRARLYEPALVLGLLLLAFVTGAPGSVPKPPVPPARRNASQRPRRRIALAAFPDDGPPFGEARTWAGYLHALGFVAVVLTSFAGPLALPSRCTETTLARLPGALGDRGRRQDIGYARAATTSDLEVRMGSSEEVAAALANFFAQNASGDVSTFDEVVSREEAVLAIGSTAGEWYSGQTAARGAYGLEGVLIDPGAVQGWENGDTGWAVARPLFSIPDGPSLRLRFTAVFVREDGRWKLIHLHGSYPVPDDVAADHPEWWEGAPA